MIEIELLQEGFYSGRTTSKYPSHYRRTSKDSFSHLEVTIHHYHRGKMSHVDSYGTHVVSGGGRWVFVLLRLRLRCCMQAGSIWPGSPRAGQAARSVLDRVGRQLRW